MATDTYHATLPHSLPSASLRSPSKLTAQEDVVVQGGILLAKVLGASREPYNTFDAVLRSTPPFSPTTLSPKGLHESPAAHQKPEAHKLVVGSFKSSRCRTEKALSGLHSRISSY